MLLVGVRVNEYWWAQWKKPGWMWARIKRKAVNFYSFKRATLTLTSLTEPLPMKQRALPQSFWQQPNVANPQPPGIIYSTLPPLPLNVDDVTDITPVEEVSSMSSTSLTSSSTSYSTFPSSESTSRRPERFVTAANTDLLFSLFNTIEEEEAQRRIHIVRRGRYVYVYVYVYTENRFEKQQIVFKYGPF